MSQSPKRKSLLTQFEEERISIPGLSRPLSAPHFESKPVRRPFWERITDWCVSHCLRWTEKLLAGNNTPKVTVVGSEPSEPEVAQQNRHGWLAPRSTSVRTRELRGKRVVTVQRRSQSVPVSTPSSLPPHLPEQIPPTEEKTEKKAEEKAPSPAQQEKKKAKKLPTERQLKPFEDNFALITFLDYDLRNRRVGAYLLKNKQEYRFVFGFQCAGLHPTLSDSEIRGIINRLENGLKDLPFNEYLTFHYRSFRSATDRLDYLKRLLMRAKSPLLQLIVLYEIVRAKELVERGIRKPKDLYLYVTYTISSEVEQSSSWYEKALAQVFQSYEMVTGDKQIREQKFENFVKQGFLDGYLKWENFLLTQLGLTVRPLGVNELWELLWARLNRKACEVSLPQWVYVGNDRVEEKIRSQLHPLTLLLAEQEPEADEEWVRVRGNYIGVMNLIEKPGGWSNCREQLRYLWSVISRERVYDIEIFSELCRANDALVKDTMLRLMKQSLTSQGLANEQNSIDVAAQIKAEQAVDAQAEIFSGSVPLWLGMTILVHRPTLSDLDEACRYLESCFLRPAWVQRERFLAWKIWLQTIPVCWERILVKPYMRRLLFLQNEVIGLIPWILPITVDKEGIELITEEGGAPVWLNFTPTSEPKHMGIFATTRAGKSVLVSGLLSPAIVYGMPVIVIDFPKPDGTSTFTDYTNNIRGAYFDISKEANNLFQIPDLSHHTPENVAIFFADFKSFLEAALMTMVFGKNTEGLDIVLRNNVRAILALALDEFFQDYEILRRYDLAMYHGQGTEYWMEMPTLHDFLAFCDGKRLGLTVRTAGVEQALEVINLRLRQWLVSRVGRAIASPTTFKADSSLIVFALRNIQDEEDAAVLALSALGSAMRAALSAPASIFFIDEAPILFEFASISNLIGRLCANGAKAGIRVILSAQDPKTVCESASGSKIIENLAVRLVGRIQPTAVASFEKYLYYPKEIVGRNATQSFFPNKTEIYSQWLLDYQGSYTYCRYYPGLLQLALVANNPDEQKLRDEVLQREQGNEVKAMISLTQAIEKKIRG